MKKTFAIFAALCALTLSACFSPWGGGGEGTITIAFGAAGPGGRTLVELEEAASFTHHVTLTGPDGATERLSFTGTGSATIAVAPGVWAIDVRAVVYTQEDDDDTQEEDDSSREYTLRAFGSGQAVVQVGRDAPAVIAMTSAAKVYNHEQLLSAVNQASGRRAKIIFIADNIMAEATYAIPAGANVTLASDKPVRIARGQGYDGVMFDVTGGSTLILGRPGMTGNITIVGVTWSPRPAASASMINVSDARLIMYQGITLTGNLGNSTIDGGAVHVGANGIFTMHGGVISNNRASHGGGVYVGGAAAAFMKTGGVIYGSDAPSNLSNTAFGPDGLGGDTGRGNAVALPIGTANPHTFDGTVRGTPAESLIWPSAAGTLTISFANFHEEEEVAAMTHRVTLSGPGGTITRDIGGDETAVFSVVPGTWTIDVRTEGPRPAGYHATFPAQMLRAVGSGQAVARFSEDTSVEIKMTDAVEVDLHVQLYSAMGLARTDGREKIIFITGNIIAGATYTIPTGANITLASASNEPVTIGRVMLHDAIMFDVARENSTLTLGRPGMTDSITINGIRQVAVATQVPGSIMRVSGGAHLVMNDGVTLTGNLGDNAVRGGAVHVGEDGDFSMRGGRISDNQAGNGGGVYVASGGAFAMYGGVIYGADGPAGSRNRVLSTGAGASLFVGSHGIARFAGAFLTTYGYGDIPTTENTLPREILP